MMLQAQQTNSAQPLNFAVLFCDFILENGWVAFFKNLAQIGKVFDVIKTIGK